MASSLFLLLDDIASALDDVAVLTKVAAKKTAGVLGDDLALNAQQVSGVSPNRELPVVWAVAKGSLVNKAILVPLALLISQFAHWLVAPLMLIGGSFLCFEGVEKLAHALFKRGDHSKEHHAQAVTDETIDLVALEKQKVKGAIRTDFILSAEIIIIALGTVADESFTLRVVTLVAISLLMTVGVYGFVAGIVKIDDLGAVLSRRTSAFAKKVGAVLLKSAPLLMKFLSVAGTIAMFLVGGGLFVHNVAPVHHLVEKLMPDNTGGELLGNVVEGLVGVAVGAVIFGVVELVKKVIAKVRAPKTA
ncbi:MAG: DUF808 domain-containing protein [Archangium sp.]